LCVGLIFSGIVFVELAEENYELIDTALKDKVADLIYLGKQADGIIEFSHSVESHPSMRRCWLKVYDANQKSIWESSVTRKIDIPLHNTGGPFTVTTQIPAMRIFPDMEADENLAFRAMSATIQIKDTRNTILVGMPIEDPVADIIELVVIIAIGFITSAIILFVISYWIAGWILKPISEINSLASIINEKTLTQRIPLGKNKDELYRLSETLNLMFDRLQFSFDKQKQFLADASHELKSPVSLLRLKIEEYLQSEDLPEEHRASLTGLSETLHRMNRLIKNLLDLSALEHTTTQLQHKEILLSKLVISVLDDFAEAFSAKHLTIHNKIPAELRIYGDLDKLRRVIVNLVDNAIKYNDEYGTVEISGRSSDSHIYLSVGNTGAGIPEADLPSIFDQFYRLEKSRSVEFGGVGLGLTIVKRIIELHGGKIEAESEPGKWTRMLITLPFNKIILFF
jgi:two-component system, OmpR family, sensor kinase